MSDANKNGVRDTKKVFPYLAACYAIIVPAGFLICLQLLTVLKIGLSTNPWVPASILISGLVMGIFSLFSRSLGIVIRALVLASTLMSAVLALMAWYLGGLHC